MSFRSNSKPRVDVGPQIDRPVSPTLDGLIYASETAISVYDELAGWRSVPYSGGGGSPVGFVVGHPGADGAQFSSFATAIAAAIAAGVNTVMFLSGTYVESFSVPANMSIEPWGADFVTTQITGLIQLTAAVPSQQSIRGFTLIGSILANAGAPTSAHVLLADVQIAPNIIAGPPALAILDDGWGFEMQNVGLDGTAAGVHPLSVDTNSQVEAFNSTFHADASNPPVRFSGAGSGSFDDCRFEGQSLQMLNSGGRLTLIDAHIVLDGSPLSVIQDVVGVVTTIEGTFTVIGLDPTGKIALNGSVIALQGVDLGSLHVVNLPSVGTDGVTAFGSDLTPHPGPVYFGGGQWRRFLDGSIASGTHLAGTAQLVAGHANVLVPEMGIGSVVELTLKIWNSGGAPITVEYQAVVNGGNFDIYALDINGVINIGDLSTLQWTAVL